MSQENWQRVRDMDEEEVQEEKRELEERFGGKMLEALRKREEARRGGNGTVDEIPKTSAGIYCVKYGKMIPADSIVDQPAPRRIDTSHRPIYNKDRSPDALKERYFPYATVETRKLEWLQPPAASSSTDTSVRFDLSSSALSEDAKVNLDPNLGLHHHGTSPDLAGYTLQDVLYLCRSTVPSQRITMLGVLAKIIAKYLFGNGDGLDNEVTKACEAEKVRQKALILGVEVMSHHPRSFGITRAGIELVYETLGGDSWNWLDEPHRSAPFQFDTDPNGLDALPLGGLLPRLELLLAWNSGLSPRSFEQLIRILRRAAYMSQQYSEILLPVVPHIIRSRVLRQPWPLEADDEPSVSSLRFFVDVITSSRTCAQTLASENMQDSLLKFLIRSTWTSDTTCLELALEVLRVFHALGRYGLCSSITTSAHDVWRGMGSWTASQTSRSPLTIAVKSVYFDCLATWTTCAIDPHRTTPEHDLTWAQVSAMGWADEAMAVIETILDGLPEGRSDSFGELASALNMLVAWIEGASINGARGGETEKAAVLNSLRQSRLGSHVSRYYDGSYDMTKHEGLIDVLCSAVQLHNRLSTEEGKEMLLEPDLIQSLISRFLCNSTYPSLNATRSWNAFRYELLRFSHQANHVGSATWAKAAFNLMLDFQPGDEPLALDVIDDLLRLDWASSVPSLTDQLSSIAHRDGLQMLRPLLHYAVLPDITHVVGPSTPSHLFLKATATLRPPAASSIPGLPLPADWFFSPLNELLSSASSPAFAQAPPDWDPSELDIVRSTLVLAQLKTRSISRSLTLLNLMKVFMLEQGQQSVSTSESDLFRDPTVSTALIALLTPSTGVEIQPFPPSVGLEEAAKPFLGEDVPFFQFYTDFVALYESISFSHPIFAQLLLPPLAMTYPVDFRKLLWAEQPTALRTIRTKMVDVPFDFGSMSAYFEPREEDPDVLAGYTRALIRGWVSEETTEFLFRLAIHHLAGLFWDGKDEGRDSPRVSLLVALLSSAGDGVLQRLLDHDLSRPGELVVVGAEENTRRIGEVDKLSGSKGSRRIASL